MTFPPCASRPIGSHGRPLACRPRAWIAAVAILCIAPAWSSTFDAAHEFSTTLNPSGPWTYGWSERIGSTFNRSEISGVVNDLDYWAGPVPEPSRPGHFPLVFHNGTDGSIFAFGSVHIDSGVLAMHPGPTGEYAILRFTAPLAGFYSLSSVFTGIDTRPTSTDVYVRVNGAQVYSNFVNQFEAGSSFATLVDLPANGTVDFGVGSGYGDFFNDSTAVSVTLTEVPGPVTAVPEPGTASLFLVGALVLGALGRVRPIGGRR